LATPLGSSLTWQHVHRDLLETLHINTVILEEAAEIIEAHVLASLPLSTQRLIQIGDHKQLRGKIKSYELQVHYRFFLWLHVRAGATNRTGRRAS
jgi:hypothetical protein